MKNRPTKSEIESSLNQFKGLTPLEEEKLIGIIDDFCENSYDEGQQDYEDENPQVNEEKVGVEYCVKAFEDCKTNCDFQDKLKEITTRSYNFM